MHVEGELLQAELTFNKDVHHRIAVASGPTDNLCHMEGFLLKRADNSKA